MTDEAADAALLALMKEEGDDAQPNTSGEGSEGSDEDEAGLLDRSAVERVLDEMEAAAGLPSALTSARAAPTGGENVVVAVRSRPLNPRELAAGATVRVAFRGRQVEALGATAVPSSSGGGGGGGGSAPATRRVFTFDHALWSTDANASHAEDGDGDATGFASQEVVFRVLGVRLLCSAWAGYNATIFAYGQTGSGKSYSISGLEPDNVPQWGLVPRICYHLFKMVKRAEAGEAGGATTTRCEVEASFLEIYNEKIVDLLAPRDCGARGKGAGGSESAAAPPLSVHELAAHGVFVKGLRKALVRYRAPSLVRCCCHLAPTAIYSPAG